MLIMPPWFNQGGRVITTTKDADMKRPPNNRNECANARALQELKDVTPEMAKQIRAIWCYLSREELLAQHERAASYARQCHNEPSTIHLRRIAIDALIDTCGVEYLGKTRRSDDPVYYCNAGDTYATTIIFSGPHLRVGCWGDLIERGSVRERDSAFGVLEG